MNPAIIVFPPGSGGNHLKNLIKTSYNKNVDCFYGHQTLANLIKSPYNKNIDRFYGHPTLATVHSEPGENFKPEDLDGDKKIAHGHFGEIMCHATLIRSTPDIKFIIISPETIEDRLLLYKRSQKIKASEILNPNHYFGAEQVFLYRAHMYHYYFGVPWTHIMNISISEWFQPDVELVLTRISHFLNISFDFNYCLELHSIWCKKNLG